MKVRYFFTSLFILSFSVVLPVNLFAEDCAVECPGDVNGDCVVNYKDFAIVAENWLKDCTLPKSLPVLRVTSPGGTQEQAKALGQALGIDPELIIFQNGTTLFIDPVGFQRVPTKPIQDEGIIEELRKGTEVDGESEIVFDAFDLKLLGAIEPVDDAFALEKFGEALRKSELLPENGVPVVDNTIFEIVGTRGNLLLPAVQLDTRVNYQFSQGDIPILGPGAQLSASFSPEGEVTQLLVACRGYEATGEVPIIQPGQVLEGLSNAANGAAVVPEGELRLVYYAPPLSDGNVQVLIPHFDVGGIAYGPEGQQANKLRVLVPATNDRRLVPSIDLAVESKGDFVHAEVFVDGGLAPYRFKWHSSSADLSEVPEDQSVVEYRAFSRDQESPETLKVTVTDDNGVSVSAVEVIQIVGLGAPDESGQSGAQASGRNFGVERAVSDLGAVNQSGFVNRFLSDGVEKKFNWTGASAWERDFKPNTDNSYVDNVDIAFYIGHGYGGGFTFESNADDGYLTYTDAAGGWGDRDLEFLTLLSCQVLKDTYDSKKWYTRWGPAFDGLHLLCGFQTNAYDWPQFGRRFADYTLGRQFFFTKVTLPVRHAWFQAKKEEQPSSVESVVMGVVGPGGCISGYNDYFWGKGPVSPDIRGSNIQAYWRVVYK